MGDKYITNKIIDHGIGSRILKIINLMSYVDFLNKKGSDYEFVYTPLNYEGFGQNFTTNQFHLYHYNPVIDSRSEYLLVCDRWENMFNYKGKKITEVDEKDTIFLVHPYLNGETEKEVFNHTVLMKDIIKSNLNIPINSQKNYLDIKIHIRRGDVGPKNHHDRWLSDEYYLNVIEKLKDKYVDNFKITIHTQRRGFNESKFNGVNIIYDDEMKDNEVWVDLINSDVLVIGKSAFSYSAGILCNGLTIYPSEGMFHNKLDKWITEKEI